MSFLGNAAASAGKAAAQKGAQKAAQKGVQKGAEKGAQKLGDAAAKKGTQKLGDAAAKKSTQTGVEAAKKSADKAATGAGEKLGDRASGKLGDAAKKKADNADPLGMSDPKKAMSDPKVKPEKSPEHKLGDAKHAEKDALKEKGKEQKKPEEKNLLDKAKDAKKEADARSREEEATAGGKVKSIVRDVGGGAATGAAAGAATGAAAGGVGAAPGAAIGAAKGAATGILKNKTTRGILIVMLLAPAMAMIMVGVMVFGVMSNAMLSGVELNGGGSDSVALANASGIKDGQAEKAFATADESQYPWTLTVAWEETLKNTNDETVRAFPASKFAAAMEELDPQGYYRQISVPLELNEPNDPNGKGGFIIPDDKEEWEQEKLDEKQKKIRETWVAAIIKAGTPVGTPEEPLPTDTPSNVTQKQAETIYDRALTLYLGVGVDSCGASTQIPVDGETDADGLNATQLAHAITAMGVAKGMFPDDLESARQAAIISLMTMKVETGFKNYANSTVPVSLDIPNDAVGNDHDSVGLMQQRVGGSWGNVGDSNYASDPRGTVTRLMTPSYAIGKFITVLVQQEGWLTGNRGELAQDVQVSAFPDRYAEEESLAQALVAKHFSSAPVIEPHPGLGWNGVEKGDSSQMAACGGVLGEGTMGVGALPIPAGNGSISSVFGPRDCSDGISSCFHRGLDLAGWGGTSGDRCVLDIPIYSISNGIVEHAPDPGYGDNNAIAIKYSDQLTFRYLHMPLDSFKVKPGDTVTAGQQIASMGSYGASTGCHLHIETRVNGEPSDPLPIIEQGFGVPLPR